jgi:hypothetical protein
MIEDQPGPVQSRRGLSLRSSAAISNAFSWGLLLGGIATVGVVLYITILAYSPVPWMDPWFFYYQLDQGHLSFLQFLWAQHNGHRIILPKLFDLWDLYWSRGNGILLLSSIYAVQALHFGVLVYCLRKLGFQSGAVFRSSAGILLFCLFSPAKREDFICGWEIAYVLPIFLSTLAFVCFAFASLRPKVNSWSPMILVGWISALAGAFSLTSGFLIWPMLCLEAAILRLPRRILLITAALGSAALVINSIGFQQGFQTAQKPIVGATIHNPGRVLSFFQFLLAESIGPVSFVLGSVLAWAGILLCLGAVVLLLKKQSALTVFELLLLIITLNAAAAVSLIAVARWNTGFTNRYEEPVLLFWAALALLALCMVRRSGGQIGVIILQIVFLVVMITATKQVPPLMAEAKLHRQLLDLAGSAFVSHVMDPAAVQYVSMPMEWTFGELKFLEKRKAALYSKAPMSLIGTNVHWANEIRSGACSGRVGHFQFDEDPTWPGFTIRGQAWNEVENKPVQWFAVTDERGNILGVGGNDSLIRNSKSGTRHSSWTAFVSDAQTGKAVRIYGLLHHGQICTVDGGTSVILRKQLPISAELAPVTRLWSPAKGLPRVVGGTAALENGILTIRSDSEDTQAYFETGVDLRPFTTLVFKARFSRLDTVELFFGKQIDGRGIVGSVSNIGQWVFLHANVGSNPYWKNEAGTGIRFDPTGSRGVGSITQIAEIWGTRTPSSSDEAFTLYSAEGRP